MSFENYLRRHDLTWHRFDKLPDDTRAAIHADWLKNRDRLSWGSWWKQVVVCVAGAFTAMVLTVWYGASGR